MMRSRQVVSQLAFRGDEISIFVNKELYLKLLGTLFHNSKWASVS